jgi:hypothetical protein
LIARNTAWLAAILSRDPDMRVRYPEPREHDAANVPWMTTTDPDEHSPRLWPAQWSREP